MRTTAENSEQPIIASVLWRLTEPHSARFMADLDRLYIHETTQVMRYHETPGVVIDVPEFEDL